MVQELVPDGAERPVEVAETVLPAPMPANSSGKLASALHLAVGSMLAAGLSGVLLGFALPTHGVAFLGWFGLAPLLYACRQIRVPAAIVLGAAAGTIAVIVGIGLPTRAVEAPLVGVLAIEFALLVGLACGAAALLSRQQPVFWAASVAVVGVCLEAFSFAGIPIHLALCFWRWTAVIQIASLTGIWGVSMLAWWMNAGIAASSYRNARPLVAPLVIFVLSQAIGSKVIPLTGEKRQPLRLAALQLGDQPSVTRPALGLKACTQDVRLAVLPELSEGERQARDRSHRGGYLAPIFRTYVVVGFVEHDRGRTYNSAGVFSPRGYVLGSYRKRHLFGGEAQVFSPGPYPDIVKLAFTTMGMPVCFDTCFTETCRIMARMGAVILASPSHDPPSPNGALYVMHAAFQPFRSVENGVVMIRADAHAMSMVTDSRGRVVSLSGVVGPDLLMAHMEITGHKTLYRWWGDWLAQICVMLGLFLIIAEAQRRFESGRTQP